MEEETTPLVSGDDARRQDQAARDAQKIRERAVLDFVTALKHEIPNNPDGTPNLQAVNPESLMQHAKNLLNAMGEREGTLGEYIDRLNDKIGRSQAQKPHLYNPVNGEHIANTFAAYMSGAFVDAEKLRGQKGKEVCSSWGGWLAFTAVLAGVLSYLTYDFYTGTGRDAGAYLSCLVSEVARGINTTVNPCPSGNATGPNATSDALRDVFDLAGIPSNSLLNTYGTWLPILVFWTLLFDRFPGLRNTRWADLNKIALMTHQDEKNTWKKLVGKATLVTIFTVAPCVTYAVVAASNGDPTLTAILVGTSNFASFFLGLSKLVDRIQLAYQPAYRKVVWEYLQTECDYLLKYYKIGSDAEKAELKRMMDEIGDLSSIANKTPQECAQIFAKLLSFSMAKKRTIIAAKNGDVTSAGEEYLYIDDKTEYRKGGKAEASSVAAPGDFVFEVEPDEEKFEVYSTNTPPFWVKFTIGGLIIASVAGTYGFVGATYLGVAAALAKYGPAVSKSVASLAALDSLPGFAGLSATATDSVAWDIYKSQTGGVTLSDHIDDPTCRCCGFDVPILKIIRKSLGYALAGITTASGGTNGYFNGITLDAIFDGIMSFKDYLPLLFAGIGLGLISAPLTNVYYSLVAVNLMFNYLAKNVPGYGATAYKKFAQFVEAFQDNVISMIKDDMADKNFRDFLVYTINLKENGKPTMASKALIAVLISNLSLNQERELRENTGIDLNLYRGHPDYQFDVRYQADDEQAAALEKARLESLAANAKADRRIANGSGETPDAVAMTDTDNGEDLDTLLDRREGIAARCSRFWKEAEETVRENRCCPCPRRGFASK